MCGRYALGRNRHELQLALDLPELDLPEPDGPESGANAPPQSRAQDRRAWPPLEELAPDYNIGPGKRVYAVLGASPAEAGQAGGPPGDASRQLRTLRWGLVPFWAKSADVGYKMINARAETVAEKPAYRKAFANRRCLIPADAYYEWQLLPKDTPGVAAPSTSPATDPDHKSRKAKSRKRPYAVRYADGRPLAFAGLFERWRDPSREDDDPRAWLWSCAVITTEAAQSLSHIHERMPVVVPSEYWSTWLDPATELDRLQPVLAATPVDELETYQVGIDVNSIRNNGPELLAPERPPAAGSDPATLF